MPGGSLLYAAAGLRVWESEIGLVLSAFAFTALLSRPIVGRLVDRFGCKAIALAGCVVFAIAPLLFVRIPQPAGLPGAGSVSASTVLRDVRVGLRYILAWPGMMIILGIAALINFLLNPTGALMPLLVSSGNHVPPSAERMNIASNANNTTCESSLTSVPINKPIAAIHNPDVTETSNVPSGSRA